MMPTSSAPPLQVRLTSCSLTTAINAFCKPVLWFSVAPVRPATVVCPSSTYEAAKTADITWVDKLAPLFAFFGGSARLLKNGNVEFDECAATPLPNYNAQIFEVTKTIPPQVAWQMHIAGQYAYRGYRISSLYPGVQW